MTRTIALPGDVVVWSVPAGPVAWHTEGASRVIASAGSVIECADVILLGHEVEFVIPGRNRKSNRKAS